MIHGVQHLSVKSHTCMAFYDDMPDTMAFYDDMPDTMAFCNYMPVTITFTLYFKCLKGSSKARATYKKNDCKTITAIQSENSLLLLQGNRNVILKALSQATRLKFCVT